MIPVAKRMLDKTKTQRPAFPPSDHQSFSHQHSFSFSKERKRKGKLLVGKQDWSEGGLALLSF